MKQRKFRLNLNIGTVIFGAIFVYLIITFILFLTHRHIETYQVITGPLSGNETCTALILRDEDVVLSTTSGYVNHFVSNDSKTGKNQLVCAVTSTLVPNEYKTLQASEYAQMRKLISKAAKSFDTVRFDSINDLKFDLLGYLWNSDSVSSASGDYYQAASDGYVAYSSDGYEYAYESDLSADMFETSVYSVSKIANQSIVESGGALYRLVNGEEWYIYFPITDKQLVRLAENLTIKVKFLKDGASETGTLSFLKNDEQRFAKITFTSGMYRYLDDRFVDIELVTNNETGLKIPVSSIVKKEFYKVPVSFDINESGTEAGFVKEVRKEDGSKTTEVVEATLYSSVTDEDTGTQYYYVDTSDFDVGDILVNKKTNEKYTINETGTLEGVYCVNRGYAEFRKITIIDQNEEYCLVESNTNYGIAQFDYIVKNGSTVEESDVIY